MLKIEKNVDTVSKNITVKDVVNIVISLIGIFLAIIEIVEIWHFFEIQQYRFVFYNTSICIIIILINVFSFMNKHKEIKAEISISKLEETNKNLLAVNDDVRCFKHDFNNIMQAINGYIDVKDINALEKYFNSVLKDCHHMNTVELLNYQVIDNPAIYAVLLNKYTIAKENDITMNIDILLSLKVFTEKAYVISRILGILLDNAIEATGSCIEKIVNVQFMKEKNKNIIVVENTYSDEEIDTNKIFDKGYSTKKSKGNSGLGLWKIKDIIKKDKALDLLTSTDNNLFKQQLEIYD